MNFHSNLSNILMSTVVTSAIVITLPQTASALTGREINDIAREVTVLIVVLNEDGESIGHGSGVIIAGNDNTYYVLTNQHVASGEENYGVRTSDGEFYAVNGVKTLSGEVDLAVVEFSSERNYPIAKISPTENFEGQEVFVSGWPAPDLEQLVRQFTSGSISGFLQEPVLGYQISYTNVTRSGMSGGPVFDTGGRVIAIHGLGGREDSVRVASSLGLTDEQAQGLASLIPSGFNYSIPISTFLQLAPQSGIYLNVQVDNSPPPEVEQPYVANSEPDSRDVIDNLNEGIDSIYRVIDTIDRGSGVVCRFIGC